MKLYALSEIKKISPLVRDLISLDDRFRFYKWVGGIEKSKALLFRKDFIFMPFKGPKIQHEIAHAVEMNNQERWVQDDFGLGFDFNVQDPRVFFSAMARELRVFGIEKRFGDTSEASTLRTFWIEQGNKLLPYGRFQAPQHLSDWANDIMLKTYRHWDEEKIRDEWNKRLEYWSDWMEMK